jgi:hypothetical protein
MFLIFIPGIVAFVMCPLMVEDHKVSPETPPRAVPFGQDWFILTPNQLSVLARVRHPP